MIRTVDVVIPAYNAADHVCDTVRLISQQQLPDEWQLNIYVSDDGSTDATRTRIAELQETLPSLQLVGSDTNAGRGAACNSGVAAGSGAVVVICDADCRYTRSDALAEFVADIEAGADLVIGLVELPGKGFWARYTNSVAVERLAGEKSKGLMAYTTANIAIRRAAFEQVQGFSPDYAKYGFEDKDLLLRVTRAELNIRIRDDITVSHDDDFTLATVCRKARESGRYSAGVFRDRFPDEYRQLPYARCDATTATGLRFLKPLAAPLEHVSRFVAAALLALPAMFFRLQRFTVRVAVCAAYFRGTRR